MAGPAKAKIPNTGGPVTDSISVAILEPFTQHLHQATHCYVAYSGGVDSHVLLHLLAQLLPKQNITALHINHQLSPNADQWVIHCQAVCAELGVCFETSKVEIDRGKLGLEAAAREARYQVFKRHLHAGDILVMAHHADDQAETLLYRILRGSGVRGLSGIPVMRPLGKGQLLRPLLNCSRLGIKQYAKFHQLHWIEDESNSSQLFDRNFLRSRIFPGLAERWPNYLSRFATSARLLNEAEQLTQVLAQQDFAQLQEARQRQGFSIDCKALRQFEPIRQNNLLRYWFLKHELPAPGYKIIDAIIDDLLAARDDAQPCIACAGAELRRYQQKLYLLPKDSIKINQSSDNQASLMPLILEPDSTLDLPDGSKLTANANIGKGLRYSLDDQLEVHFRQGGERCQPAGRSGSNSLKHLFQEYQLEPWLRNKVPLVYLNGELAAVGDLWVCEKFLAKPAEKGLQLTWVY